jgi:hypothetical protein
VCVQTSSSSLTKKEKAMKKTWRNSIQVKNLKKNFVSCPIRDTHTRGRPIHGLVFCLLYLIFTCALITIHAVTSALSVTCVCVYLARYFSFHPAERKKWKGENERGEPTTHTFSSSPFSPRRKIL